MDVPFMISGDSAPEDLLELLTTLRFAAKLHKTPLHVVILGGITESQFDALLGDLANDPNLAIVYRKQNDPG